jgi:hypothetical protein
MSTTRVAGSEVQIDMLREQIVGLADADCVRLEDEALLLAALEAVLRALAAGDLPAARAGLVQFIAGAEGLIAAGVLAALAGDPPLAAARALLAALCDEEPGCRRGRENRARAPARHRKSFEHEQEREHEPKLNARTPNA